MEPIEQMILYAWVGEDELGSGEVGIKQGICPAGMIPLVACREGKMDQEYLVRQMQQQSNRFGKTIRLCKFTFQEVVTTLEPQK